MRSRECVGSGTNSVRTTADPLPCPLLRLPNNTLQLTQLAAGNVWLVLVATCRKVVVESLEPPGS